MQHWFPLDRSVTKRKLVFNNCKAIILDITELSVNKKDVIKFVQQNKSSGRYKFEVADTVLEKARQVV